MYLSLLQIKNFRCFDGNEHSITFKKGLNVLVEKMILENQQSWMQ